MAVLKRNIWTLFVLLLLGGGVLLAAILYMTWQGKVQRYESYHQNRAELVAQSVNSILSTQELVLDVVGRELLRQGEPLESIRHLPLLDSILKSNPVLVAFGLARPDGQLVRISSNLDAAELPNLLEQPVSRKDFRYTLNTDKMVLGRTYFMGALGDWVVPVRKALRNGRGEVVAVMTAGLRLEGVASVFARQLHEGRHDSVTLVRDRDGFVQFLSREGTTPADFSRMRRSEERRQTDGQALQEQAEIPLHEIRASETAVPFHWSRDSRDYLGAVIYDVRYELWVTSEVEKNVLRQEFALTVLLYLLIYTALGLATWGIFRIIANAEQERHEELLYLSRHDDLTGLPNRIGLNERIDTLVNQATAFGLVLVDVDNFRGVNDRYGQEYGDQVLTELGRRLRQIVSNTDRVTRLGGDEFVLVCQYTDGDRLSLLAHEVIELASQPMPLGTVNFQLSVSIGMAVFPKDGLTFDELLRSAHLALYEAKSSKNSACFYRSEMDVAYLRRVTVEQRLRQALSGNELFMVYQPQLDRTGKTVGLEALVRWQDDELGFVPPDEFVAVAESSGQMMDLGHFVLDTSLSEFSGLLARTGSELELAINISVLQFIQPGFTDSLLLAVEKHDVCPSQVTLEITETLFMSNFEKVLSVLERIRALGFRISMDDFGTGYSSLSLLRKLPLDELKIDKSFIDDIDEDARARDMVQSIIAIGTGYRMLLVAEGVETEKQFKHLLAMKCNRFQGYYFARPARINDLDVSGSGSED